MVTWPALAGSGAALSAMLRPVSQSLERRQHMQGALRHCIAATSAGDLFGHACPSPFPFRLTGNTPVGLSQRRRVTSAAQRPTVESSYIRLQHHRRAAPLIACGCCRQPSKPGVFDTGGGHFCLFCLFSLSKHITVTPSTLDGDFRRPTPSMVPYHHSFPALGGSRSESRSAKCCELCKRGRIVLHSTLHGRRL